MKKLLSWSLAATLAIAAIPSLAQTAAWGRAVPGTNGAVSTPGDGKIVTRTLAVDASGNAFVTGASGSGTSADIVTAKIDGTTGAIAWQKAFSGAGAGEDDGYAVAVDASGNVIVAGLSYTTASNIDIKVIKYAAADGTVLWQRTIDASAYDAAYAVGVDASGNAIVAAESGNAAGNIDIHVLKLAAATGATLWDKTFDGGKDDFVSDLAVDASGNAIVTGVSVNAAGNDDFRIVKYAADGTLAWSQAYGSAGDDELYAVALDSAGNVFVTGMVPGTNGGDAKTLKLAAATGAVMWQQVYDGGKDDAGQAVAVDGSGNAIVAIQSQNAAGNYDFRTIKYAAADGAVLWNKVFDGGADDFAYQVATDAAGNAIVTGSSAGANGDDWKTIAYASADGAVLMQHSYGGSANAGDAAFNLVASSTGIYLAGVATETGAAQSIRVMKLAALPAASTSSTSSNVASAASITASSTFGAGYTVAALTDGDRAGRNWSNGGGWADGTIDGYPDWVELNLGTTKSITSLTLYTVQDNWQTPVEPTDTMTFTKYGVTDFNVLGWNGSAWVTLGSVTGNNLVKRTVTFPAFTTDRVRVQVTRALAGVSRITEVEVGGTAASGSATPPASPTQVNVALAANGAVALASSTINPFFAASGAIDGERAGARWSNGGGWADGTVNQYPDWLEVDFAGRKVIDHVVLYTVQDNWQNPVEPTDTLTFTQYGITAYTVQGWDGAKWVDLGTVTGNKLVKSTVSFAAYTTDRIRINVTAANGLLSRITEVEAWGTPVAAGTNVALASSGATATASSSLNGSFPVGSLIDGERAGAKWTAGGGWADATLDAYPDWVQVNFGASKSISRVVVYTVQDNWQAPVEPTDGMLTTLYGIQDFTVQGWDGSQWVTLATVSGNDRVKRTVSFAAFSTDRIRVNVTRARAALSRITEVEAWTQ